MHVCGCSRAPSVRDRSDPGKKPAMCVPLASLWWGRFWRRAPPAALGTSFRRQLSLVWEVPGGPTLAPQMGPTCL